MEATKIKTLSGGLYDILMAVDGDMRLKVLSISSVMTDVFSNVYNVMVRDKQLVAIEEIEQEQKVELYGIANEHLPDETKEKKIKYCRAVWAVLHIMNNT